MGNSGIKKANKIMEIVSTFRGGNYEVFIELIPEVMKSLTQEEFEQFVQEFGYEGQIDGFEFTNKDDFVLKKDYKHSDFLRDEFYKPFR